MTADTSSTSSRSVEEVAHYDKAYGDIPRPPAASEKPQRTAISWHHKRHDRHEREREYKPWYARGRGLDDDLETDWWFASTAIPLLAATLSPLANMLSIAALVTPWRLDLIDPANPGGDLLPELLGNPFDDPRWCYWLNVGSLTCGFMGNVFLLFNFTGAVRYILALPLTIFLFFIATGILMGITASMHIYAQPLPDVQGYTQGFWYAIFAAILYLICSMLLMVNMLGYFIGHYPQKFNLTGHQRTLIIQTMLFFVWLAGGGAMFSKIQQDLDLPDKRDWAFVDGMYFCDVTILTVGFGDLFPSSDLARGLVFPYSVGGIIMLGLVISSLHKFAADMGQDKIVRKHMEKQRSRTLERTVTEDTQLTEEDNPLQKTMSRRQLMKLKISAPYNIRRDQRRPSIFDPDSGRAPPEKRRTSSSGVLNPVSKHLHVQATLRRRKPKLILLKEEKDRFLAMRRIQRQTGSFKKWWALTLSVIGFAVLWLVGAVVFWQCEKYVQGMTYFQGLYFAYVSLLTIGYGDWAPKSNAGRAFFVVWSLIAVPFLTLLISDMSGTVIDAFKNSSEKAADFTLLPEKGAIHDFFQRHPWLINRIQQWKSDIERRKRQRNGMGFPQASDADHSIDAEAMKGSLDTPGDADPPTMEALANEAEQDHKNPAKVDEGRLAKRLAIAIRNVATDLRAEHERKYSYEEWVELTRLIRFTSEDTDRALQEEDERGMVDWDWIGEDSPMMSGFSEPEFVLQRLCESLGRYVRRAEKRKREWELEKNGVVAKSSPNARRTSVVTKEELFGQGNKLPKTDEEGERAEEHHCSDVESDVAPDDVTKRSSATVDYAR